MNLLEETMRNINPANKEVCEIAWKRIDNLTKPIGSLGTLEEISAKMSGITGKIKNKIDKKNIIIMCSDNGVYEMGVSNCPQEVTAIVTNNFTKGITGVCVLSEFYNSDMTVVDVGIKTDINNDKVIDKKIAYGTRNMAKEPAMTRNQAIKAIEVGIEIVESIYNNGYDIIGTGEMGIGNTTTSAAVLSVLSGLSPDIITGYGSGLTKDQLENKKEVIKKAIDINKPDREDPIDVLAKVGGFDIAALCGCFLAAARFRIPIVIDGIISCAAALSAFRLDNNVKDFIFPSHLSEEPGAAYALEEMGLQPMLNLNMRLGEGSGCPLAFSIIEGALYTINNMGTFQDAEVDSKNYVDIREKK